MNIFLIFLCLVLGCLRGEEPKILVLIIASDDQPVYREMQNLWRSYMHLDPDHIEAYFLKGDPDLPYPTLIQSDVLYCKTAESLKPGILNKTLLAMEHFLPRLHEFSYVLRTNLSSFYIFPRLVEFAKTQPPAPLTCYALPYYIHTLVFPSGSGFLMSPDLVEQLLAKKETLDYLYPDDMAIGFFLQNEGLPIHYSHRTDFTSLDNWKLYKDQIPSSVFHIRVKNDNPDRRASDEIYIQKQLIKMFYGIE